MPEKLNRLARALALSGALLTAGLGAWVTQGEARSFLVSGGSAPARVLTLADNQGHIGFATGTQKAFLADCAKTLWNLFVPEVLAMSEAQRQSLAPTCQALARQAIADSPTNVFAYYVLAASAAAQGDVALYNDSLALSYRTGPSEQWIAAWRVGLAETMHAATAPALAAHHDHDIALLIQGFVGIEAIARRFVADEAFRARVTRLLETMPPERAERFLSHVRRQIG